MIVEEKAITLFKKWFPRREGTTIVNLNGERFMVTKKGSKITAKAVK